MNKIESAYKEMMGTCSPSMIAYCMKDKALELERELTAARAEIERLDTVGIHSCHDNCQRWTCVLRMELRAVTEQRDELLRYNEAFRKETLICADCDAIRKEEYDQAIEQRDRLAEALKKLTEYDLGDIPIGVIRKCNEALQSLTTNVKVMAAPLAGATVETEVES